MINEDKVNILLVDDQAENLLALEAVIGRDDFNLTGLNGFEMAKFIKSRENSKHIPIIFITDSNMDEQHMCNCYDAGAIDYIRKPFDPNSLRAKVQGFVEMHRMNRKLVQQTDKLLQKTHELEKAYQELSVLTSELRKSQAMANVISETSIDSMLILDENGVILKVNPAVTRMFGYADAELLGEHLDILFRSPKTRRAVKQLLTRSGGAEYFCEEAENGLEWSAIRKDGSAFAVEFQIGQTVVDDKCIVACTIRDVSRKKQSEQLIKHMAYHDGLTDLPNRRLFHDRLHKEVRQAKQDDRTLAMMYLDLDRFKHINDSLGHPVGDKLLQEIAKRLANGAREGDFVARVGGDEFNIMLPDTSREEALQLAEAMLERLKQPINIEHYELYVTASIGISVYPHDGEDPLELVKNADAALYRAKELGKNGYQIYHSGMNLQSYRTFVLQNDLRKAVERGEMALFYEPRMDVKTGAIVSAEARIRWNHPSWGQLLPSEFIPLAEETGQMSGIGEWILRTACEQHRSWRNAGLPSSTRIAIPMSSQLILQKNFVSMIHRILTETSLPPDLLEIEISESAWIHNESIALKALEEVKKLGIRIILGKFGSGFSSLSTLQSIPADIVKIDPLFIQDLSSNPGLTHAFLSSLVSIAHSLKMAVAVEEIEMEEPLISLKKLNIMEMQGPFFSPPVPPEEMERLLASGIPAERVSAKGLVENEETGSQDVLDFQLYQMKEAFSISTREQEVFKLVVNGLNNKEISEKLFISEHTVKNYITRIFQKLNVNDRLQAMAKVYQSCIQQDKAQ